MTKANKSYYLLIIFISFFLFSFLYSVENTKQKLSLVEKEEEKLSQAHQKGYTINLTNVSILEYIHFVSKICQVNFLFNEEDLNFKMSVISQEPIIKSDIMSSLIQILRVHGLTLLEEDSNLVIHKNPDVKQLGTVISQDEEIPDSIAIITRIFKIENIPIASLVSVLSPMISKEAVLEASSHTRHIIITDITENIQKIKELIEVLDAPDSPLRIEFYRTQWHAPDKLIPVIKEIMAPVTGGNPFILVGQDSTDMIYMISTPGLIKQMHMVLETLDAPAKKQNKNLRTNNVFIYKTLYRSPSSLERSLKGIAENLIQSGYQKNDLIDTINDMKTVPSTSSILFTGPNDAIVKLKEILLSIDISSMQESSMKEDSFFMYSSQSLPASELKDSLEQIANKLKKEDNVDEELIKSIDNAQIIKKNNAIIFTGSKATFAKIKQLIATLDKPISKDVENQQKPTFFIFPLNDISKNQIIKTLDQIAQNLQETNFPDQSVVKSIETAKYIPESDSMMFTGSNATLQKVQGILKNITAKTSPESSGFFLYHPEFISKEQLEGYVTNLANQLNKTGLDEQNLIDALKSIKWIPDSGSFIFHGKNDALSRIKNILTTYDSADNQKKISASSNYYLYKLQHISGKTIEEDLDNFAKKLRTQKVQQPQLLNVLENIKWIKETNSLLLTGYPKAIEEAKVIIAQYDVARKDQSLEHSNFYLYKPQHMPASFIQKSLKELRENLEKAKLTDPNLINAINSMKFVESTGSLVFTGNQSSIEKLKSILQLIDSPDASQIGGKTTVLIYQIKYASIQSLSSSLKAIADDLKKTKSADELLIAALNSMKYEKNTNSLIFTGVPSALAKIKPILEKFDVITGQATATAPSNFFVYKPQYLSGPSLENILKEFAEHLKVTGFSNDSLFNTIDTMKYAANTNSLIFSGNAQSIAEVKNLLATFDIPQEDEVSSGKGIITPKGLITPVDKSSFLVYKLQYHKGNEIQSALRSIAKDLIATNAPIQQNLLNAINSIQWISVTNSLLCTGDQETMTRLKELIKNLDIPLKQVFIEMLVIETSLANLLQFGLNWGNRFKFRDRFTSTMSNFDPAVNVERQGSFGESLADISASRTPRGTDIPFESKFDLGVIGDIIMHKGKSFISLGSLLDALQNDSETSIIMTPKLIAQDGKTASIFIGRNIPFTGSNVTNSGSSTVTTANLEYRDIGMNLSLTPVLGNSDTVTLSIIMEKSAQATNADGTNVTASTSGNVTGITTSKTNMTTTVHIPNKSFLVLSGMVTDTNTRTKTGFPCLGGIPLIGAAFSSTSKDISKDNLVIFIRPHILTSYEDMQHITESQEDFFRENAGSQSLEQDFEESIEQYKTLDIDDDGDYDYEEDEEENKELLPEDFTN